MAIGDKNSYAVVAIPPQDDYVWRLSSEKIPHLTLLYLGDKIDNLNHVKEYIRHAASTTLINFHLDVESRGVLGDDSADVLFFDKKNAGFLEDFRQNLLTHTDIFKAYSNVEQFPSWIPHLTMGYPHTPAKPDKRNYPGIDSVWFDRIALWSGNYKGVEFPLKTNDSEELSMTLAKGKSFIEHYGVKGMRWGVLRDRAAKGGQALIETYAPSSDAVISQKYMTRAKLGGVRNLSNQEMKHVINRMQLEKQYKELYGEKQWHNAGKKWLGNFANDVLRDVVTSWLRNPFASKNNDNPARYQAWTTGQGFARVIDDPRYSRRAIGS